MRVNPCLQRFAWSGPVCPEASWGNISRPFPVELDLQNEAVIFCGCCPSPFRVTTASVAGPGCLASPILSPLLPHVLDRGCWCLSELIHAELCVPAQAYLRKARSGHARARGGGGDKQTDGSCKLCLTSMCGQPAKERDKHLVPPAFQGGTIPPFPCYCC